MVQIATDKNISLESDWNILYIAYQWMNSGNRRTVSDRNSMMERFIVEVPSVILLS
jgi:hypothetical protein